MKVLFICNRSPFEPDMGNAQRTAVILQGFLDNKCHVDVAYIGSNLSRIPKELPNNLQIVLWNNGHVWKKGKLSEWKRRLLVNAHPKSFELEHKIKNIVAQNDYDFIFCRYIENASLAGVFGLDKKILLDIDDLPEKSFKVYLNNVSWVKRIYYGLKLISLQRYTHYCIKKSYISFLPNKEEAKDRNVTFLPNISYIHKVELEFKPQCKNILFIGFMSWPANYNGMDSFISHCWNNILAGVPEAKLLIAGKGLPNELKTKWESYHNIEYLGYVESLYDFYSMGNIVVCPIYSGAGTNIKVIEAMAMGKACAISSHSTRGYEEILLHGENVVIADNFTEFSNNLIDLLNDGSKCREIAGIAMKTAQSFFSQKTIDETISDIIKE